MIVLRQDDAFVQAARWLVDLLGPPPETEPESALWVPLPGPQTAAYCCPADELFYGGAAGGAKTDLVLGLAVTAHTSSIVFRREFAQFRGSEGIIERSRQIIGNQGRLNENLFTWRGLPGGRSIEFGAVQHDADKVKYRGRPHDFVGFDELPEFLESQYRFLIAWLRTTRPGQRTRVVGTGNPPTTSDGQWVIRYWAPWLEPQHPNPAKPGELRWFAMIDGKDVEVPGPEPIMHRDEVIHPRSRSFIPARVEDNPYLMNTGYADVLANLPEPLRSQLRFGNFQATQDDDPWQVIPTAWVRAAQQRWRTQDKPDVPLSAVGVDPARGGPDKFTIAHRYGHWVAPVTKHEGSAAPDGVLGAQLVFRAVDGCTDVPIGIDVIGSAGSSVFDQARLLSLKATGLNGSESSAARDKSGRLGFVNKRAAWHWHLRELLDPASPQEIALPDDPELLADLTASRWHPTPRGVQVELKEDIKSRLGRSPDTGEAVIYAFAEECDPGAGFMAWIKKQAEAAKTAPTTSTGGQNR